MKRTDKAPIQYPEGTTASDRRFVRNMIVSVKDFIRKTVITDPSENFDMLLKKNPSILNPFVVSCSGGIDSTCLLHICFQIATIDSYKFRCVYINHGLRPEENKNEIQFLKLFSKNIGIDFDIFDGKTEKGSGLQERARKIRQEIYNKLIEDGYYLFLAHTKSDDIETLLMRTLQGKFFPKDYEVEAREIHGIPVISGCIYRPLMNHTRKDIERYMKVFNLSWCEDSSNSSTDYFRNHIRNVLLPSYEEWKNKMVSRNKKDDVGIIKERRV